MHSASCRIDEYSVPFHFCKSILIKPARCFGSKYGMRRKHIALFKQFAERYAPGIKSCFSLLITAAVMINNGHIICPGAPLRHFESDLSQSEYPQRLTC